MIKRWRYVFRWMEFGLCFVSRQTKTARLWPAAPLQSRGPVKASNWSCLPCWSQVSWLHLISSMALQTLAELYSALLHTAVCVFVCVCVTRQGYSRQSVNHGGELCWDVLTVTNPIFLHQLFPAPTQGSHRVYISTQARFVFRRVREISSAACLAARWPPLAWETKGFRHVLGCLPRAAAAAQELMNSDKGENQ